MYICLCIFVHICIYLPIYIYIYNYIGVYWQQFVVNASNIKLTMGFFLADPLPR